MSWIDKIKNDIVITTGDGKPYTPNWINAKKSTEYNVSEFEFPEISGTLVDRRTPKGRKFPLELFFQGDNHLDTAEAFENSAADPRPWIIAHPFYGQLTVQPISLEIDNSAYNVSKINALVIETITNNYPQGSTVPADKIQQDAATVNETAAGIGDVIITATLTGDNIPAPGSPGQSINKFKGALKAINNAVQAFQQDLEKAQSYFNAFNAAQGAIVNLTAAPLAALQFSQAVITAPALFTQSVKSRIDCLTTMFPQVGASIINVANTMPSIIDKMIYQTLGSTIITAMCQAASTPISSDYGTVDEVVNTIGILETTYAQFLANLDGIQSTNGGAPGAFIPDAETMAQLDALLNYALAQLFNIAQNAKVRRTLILEKDSNWILLAHRLYGLDQADANLNLLMAQNGAGLDSIFSVVKNTPVYYFI